MSGQWWCQPFVYFQQHGHPVGVAWLSADHETMNHWQPAVRLVCLFYWVLLLLHRGRIIIHLFKYHNSHKCICWASIPRHLIVPDKNATVLTIDHKLQPATPSK